MSKSIQLKNRNNEKIYPYPYYPVGSIYSSTNNTNPTNYFGGTWELIDEPELVASAYYYFGNIRNAYNITSIERVVTGTWVVTFSKEMKDNNYVPLVSAERDGIGKEVTGIYSKYTSSFRVDMTSITGDSYNDDNMELNIAVFGRLKNPTKYVWKRTA